MIYVDTSVMLAHLFDEQRAPPADFWRMPLVSSELLEYELMVRVHARGLSPEPARRALARVSIVRFQSAVLTRALQPFPVAVRTLDALHLATFYFLRERGQKPSLATLDERMRLAAVALEFPLAGI